MPKRDLDELLADGRRLDVDIDNALMAAAVARLPGVPGGWFGCHYGDVVQIGNRSTYMVGNESRFLIVAERVDNTWHWEDHDEGVLARPGSRHCWADSGDDVCEYLPDTAVGLCFDHYKELIG